MILSVNFQCSGEQPIARTIFPQPLVHLGQSFAELPDSFELSVELCALARRSFASGENYSLPGL